MRLVAVGADTGKAGKLSVTGAEYSETFMAAEDQKLREPPR
jgi:hypothetical protein